LDARLPAHVLIDASPSLGAALEAIEPGRARPLIFSAQPIATAFARIMSPDARTPATDIVPPEWALLDDRDEDPWEGPWDETPAGDEAPRLVGFLPWRETENRNTQAAGREIERCVREARGYFDLPEHRPVRVVCAGDARLMYARDVEAADPDRREIMRDWSAHFYAARVSNLFEGGRHVRTEWLADAYPEFRRAARFVADRPLPKGLNDLASEARRAADTISTYPVGAVAAIYTYDGRRWGRFGPRSPIAPAVELLERFIDEDCEFDGAILSIMAPTIRARQNRLDNPIMTPSLASLAAEAGMNAILLDAQVGVYYDADAPLAPSRDNLTLPLYLA